MDHAVGGKGENMTELLVAITGRVLAGGIIAALLAGCTAGGPASPTAAVPTAAPSPSQSAAGQVAPPAPTHVTGVSHKPAYYLGKPYLVHLAWRPAAGPATAFAVYEYNTGEGPGYGMCSASQARRVLDTRVGATAANATLGGVTGAGVACLFVAAYNAAGVSPLVLAWKGVD